MLGGPTASYPDSSLTLSGLSIAQDLNDRVPPPLGYLSSTPDPDDDLMELPEDCLVMM